MSNNSPHTLGTILNPTIPMPPAFNGQIQTYTGSNGSSNLANVSAPANASPAQQLQVATNQNQLLQTQTQLQKMQLPPFEITSVPWSSNYPPNIVENYTGSTNSYLGWFQIGTPLSFYEGTSQSNNTFTLLNTKVTSQAFYITNIDIAYFEPDYGMNNYTLQVNNANYQNFTNFRNFKNKASAEGYFISGANIISLQVTSMTGLIQPCVATIIGFGSLSAPISSGLNNTMPSWQIMA